MERDYFFSSNATAYAQTPSSRPAKPIFSFVVAFTDTASCAKPNNSAMILRMVLFGLAVMINEDTLYGSNGFFQALMHVLPITDASVAFKYILIKGQINGAGQFVSVFQHPSFYFLMVSCVLWTGSGMLLFKAMENWARSKGTHSTSG